MSDKFGHPLPDPVVELIAQRFAVLAEPTRIKILDHLRGHGEAPVGDIAEAIGQTHANVSRHLNVLLREAIVARRKDGTKAIYSIADEMVFRLCEEVCGGLAERHRELGTYLHPEEAAA